MRAIPRVGPAPANFGDRRGAPAGPESRHPPDPAGTRGIARTARSYGIVRVARRWPSRTGDSGARSGDSSATPGGNSTITVEP